MEEKIKEYIDNYGYSEGQLVGYQGGYPIISLSIPDCLDVKCLSQRELDKIVRNAELVEGRKLGVGLNFRRTAYVRIQNNCIIVSGYVTIIDRVLEEISKKCN